MLPDRRSIRIGSETTQADVEAVPDVDGRTGLRRTQPTARPLAASALSLDAFAAGERPALSKRVVPTAEARLESLCRHKRTPREFFRRYGPRNTPPLLSDDLLEMRVGDETRAPGRERPGDAKVGVSCTGHRRAPRDTRSAHQNDSPLVNSGSNKRS